MATFKSKMKHLEEDWPDKIWEKAQARNDGKGATWMLPLAALALTGVRPASLEKGIVFEVKNENGIVYLFATYQGAKILKNADGTAKRGQDKVELKWRLSPPKDSTHRPKELAEIIKNLVNAPRKIIVSYDAEAISTRLRELSKEIWPRKNYHVSGVCYRELFASKNKEAGVDAEQLAMAMGHISAEAQGKYARKPRRASDAVAPPKQTFGSVKATTKVAMKRAPMARFKAAASLKKAMKAKI